MNDALRSGDADLLRRLEQLNRIGIALSQEKDINSLLETILVAAKDITNADGGTLYRMTEEKSLRFEIMRNDTLNIAMGGTSGIEIPFYPIYLYDKEGLPIHSMVASYAVHHDRSVNIADAYTQEGFDFSGTKSFDRKTGYRSQSFLTVPMKNHEGQIIGVLQLINAKDRATGTVAPFSETDQHLAESLASQAAIALTTRLLINHLEDLFESFISLINAAIDDKSPYTGGHCQRVPVLTMLLAEAVNNCHVGPLRDFTMTERDRYELKIAGLLHDCGKVTTPVHVVDKATKLQTIYDRISLVDTRFEVVRRDAEITLLRKQLAALQRGEDAGLKRELAARTKEIDEDREFLRQSNTGGESMKQEDIARVKAISEKYRWRDSDGRQSAVSVGGRALQPHHPLRHADADGAPDHQPPHRGDDTDAGGAAVAQPPEERGGVRRRTPRAHGRQGLSARPETRTDVDPGALHGDRRHLRGADGQGPALQEGQDAHRGADDPREVQAERPRRSRSLRRFHVEQGLRDLRQAVPRSRPDRRGGRGQDPRLRAAATPLNGWALPHAPRWALQRESFRAGSSQSAPIYSSRAPAGIGSNRSRNSASTPWCM
jgi:hypothetical protein